jgi:CheY-like chemotaxis protein
MSASPHKTEKLMSQIGAKPPTILVAEDDEDNRLVMKMLLELRGYRVLVAANGQEALLIAEREYPDLIIMDLRMPQLNGLATARQLRQHESPALRIVPIIALSAYDPSQHRNVALAAGCNDYVTKPINYEQLERLIKDYLSPQRERAMQEQTPSVSN